MLENRPHAFFGYRRRFLRHSRHIKSQNYKLIHAGSLPGVECVVCYECNWDNSAKNSDRNCYIYSKTIFLKTCLIREYLYVFQQDSAIAHTANSVF